MSRPGGSIMIELRRPCLLPLLFLSLALAVVVSLAAPPPAPAFSDVDPAHPYAAAIADLAARGIISGRLDGTFAPDEPVSRCQFAKLVVNTLGIAHTDLSMPFRDVGPDDLPEYVAAAARGGITRGTDATGQHFSPWGSVTRAQAVTMTVRGVEGLDLGLVAENVFYFSDWGPFDNGTHLEAADKAQASGLLTGLPLAQLDPWLPMTRGEIAQMLANVLRVMDEGVPGEPAEVTSVGEDATLHATFRGVEETVRMIGIALPVREPYHQEAMDMLSSMVEGKPVVLQLDRFQRDEEGHLLAYVFSSGELVNAELLRAGLALGWSNTQFDSVGLRLWRPLDEGAFEGKANRRGLWVGWRMPPFTFLTWHDLPAGEDDLNQDWVEFRSTEAISLLGWYVENYRGDRYSFPDIVIPVGEIFRIHSGSGADGPNDLHWGASSMMWIHVIDRWTTDWVITVYDDQDRLVDGAGMTMNVDFVD